MLTNSRGSTKSAKSVKATKIPTASELGKLWFAPAPAPAPAPAQPQIEQTTQQAPAPTSVTPGSPVSQEQ